MCVEKWIIVDEKQNTNDKKMKANEIPKKKFMHV